MGRSEEDDESAFEKEGVSVVWGPRLAGAKNVERLLAQFVRGGNVGADATTGGRASRRTNAVHRGAAARVAASDSSLRARGGDRATSAGARRTRRRPRVAPRADSPKRAGRAPSPCTAVRGATGVFFSRAIVALAAHLRVLARDLRAVGEGGDERRGRGGGRRGRVRQDEPGHGLIHGRHRGAGALAEDRAHHRGLRGRGQRGKRHPGVRRGGDPARRRAERVGESHDGRREAVPRARARWVFTAEGGAPAGCKTPVRDGGGSVDWAALRLFACACLPVRDERKIFATGLASWVRKNLASLGRRELKILCRARSSGRC